MRKRVLSVFLSVVLLLSCADYAVFAAEVVESEQETESEVVVVETVEETGQGTEVVETVEETEQETEVVETVEETEQETEVVETVEETERETEIAETVEETEWEIEIVETVEESIEFNEDSENDSEKETVILDSETTINIEDFAYTIENEKVIISKYVGIEETVEVPAEIEGYPVVSIGQEAFKDCTTIKEITLPETIKNIYNLAFSSCSQLEKMNWNCIDLDTFYANAFSNCEAMTTVNFGEKVETVYRSENGKLYGDNLQEYVVNPNNQSFIAKDGVLFKWNNEEKSSLTIYSYPIAKSGDNYIMDKTVSAIAKYAFSGVKFLKNLELNENINEINGGTIVICELLETIDFGGVTEYYYGALKSCNSLKYVTIQKNIEYMGSAFEDCNAIIKLTLGKDVTEIKNVYLFGNGIQEYAVEEGNAVLVANNGVLYKKEGNEYILLSYPIGKMDESYNIDINTTIVYENAFEQNLYLKTIDFNDKCHTIGDYAFDNAKSLESIDFSSCVDYKIERNAFRYCSNLKEIVFGNGLSNIEWGAFLGCDGLEEVVVTGNGSCVLEEAAFSNCKNMKKVTLEEWRMIILSRIMKILS